MKFQLINATTNKIDRTKIKRYFFEKNYDLLCYNLAYYKKQMIESNLTELTLSLAKKINEFGMFYCKEFEEIGEKSESNCGKECKHYDPRNGKSGACKKIGFVYENTEEKYILKLCK